jgi:hypothetical protein
MERLVDKLSIRDKPPTRDNVPQIRNLNYRGPRQQDPNPPRIVQRGERIPNDPNNGNNDQVRPPCIFLFWKTSYLFQPPQHQTSSVLMFEILFLLGKEQIRHQRLLHSEA